MNPLSKTTQLAFFQSTVVFVLVIIFFTKPILLLVALSCFRIPFLLVTRKMEKGARMDVVVKTAFMLLGWMAYFFTHSILEAKLPWLKGMQHFTIHAFCEISAWLLFVVGLWKLQKAFEHYGSKFFAK